MFEGMLLHRHCVHIPQPDLDGVFLYSSDAPPATVNLVVVGRVYLHQPAFLQLQMLGNS